MILKAIEHDSSNYRLYAKDQFKNLYCFCEGDIYFCSKDGEPAYLINENYTLNGFSKSSIELLKKRNWHSEIVDLIGWHD